MRLSNLFFALSVAGFLAASVAPHQLILAGMMLIAALVAKANEKPKS